MKEFLQGLAISIISVLSPIHTVIIAVGALIGIDYISGILAARKRGESIKSAGLRRTVSKMIIYQLAVISAFVVQQYLIGNSIPVSKITAGIIGTVELTSIFENLNTIHGSNVFKKVLNLLGSPNDQDKPKR